MYSLRSTGSLQLVDDDPAVAEYQKLVAFEDAFRHAGDQLPVHSKVVGALSKYISAQRIHKSVLEIFPIIETLRTYTLKDLPNDMIAGVTSGVMMIPQGMAYAALSTLPPIVGLYISFFSSVTYFVFGTGRQLSWGCIAILSLMIATALDKYDSTLVEKLPAACGPHAVFPAGEYACNTSVLVVNTSSDLVLSANCSNTLMTSEPALSLGLETARTAERLEIASGVSVVSGIIFIVASRIGLSHMANIMSNSLITGFTVGISFHVITSQIKIMFGLSIPRYSGVGALLKTWVTIVQKLPETNLATLLISAISILVIYLVKRFINDRYKKHLRLPVPIELLVVIAATLISRFTYLHDHFNVKVVETVPVGVPAPRIPDLSQVIDYIGDGIIIIVIAYAQTLAMAKTLGLKHNYIVDSNQEMLACGMCSVICGLFSGYIPAASVSRSFVQDGAGGKTQLASLVAAGLVLLVIMVMGPYFYYLPMCVLSAIIVVSLQTVFLKLLDIPREWGKSSYDCTVWVCACISCVVLNAELGLLASVLLSLFLVVFRAMLSPVVEVGQIPISHLSSELRSLEKYSSAKQTQFVKIIKITTPLYFVNAEIFTENVFTKTGIEPMKVQEQLKVCIKDRQEKKAKRREGSDTGETMLCGLPDSCVRVVVLDAAEVVFIDLMGVQALQFLIEELSAVGVEVLVTSVPESIIPMLKSTGFWVKYGEHIFLTVQAALASIVTAKWHDASRAADCMT